MYPKSGILISSDLTGAWLFLARWDCRGQRAYGWLANTGLAPLFLSGQKQTTSCRGVGCPLLHSPERPTSLQDKGCTECHSLFSETSVPKSPLPSEYSVLDLVSLPAPHNLSLGNWFGFSPGSR